MRGSVGSEVDRIRAPGIRARGGVGCVVVADRGKGFCADTDAGYYGEVTKGAALALDRLEALPVPRSPPCRGSHCAAAAVWRWRATCVSRRGPGWMPAAGGTTGCPGW